MSVDIETQASTDPAAEDSSARRAPAVLARFAAPIGLQVLAFVVAIAVSLLLVAALGYDVGAVLAAVVDGAFGSAHAVSSSLTQAAPLVLTATAVWLAYQVGLFNVGGDGQLQVGGLAALVVALALGDLPGVLTIAVAVVAAVLGGAAWAAVAGLLRAYRGANEVISTIMLNFVAATAISLLIAGPLRSPSAKYTPRTDRVAADAQLGDAVPGIPLTFLVALALGVVTVVAVRRTSIGLRLRTIGLNREAATHAGLRVQAMQWQAFAVSGGLAGLAGGLVILGYRYYIAPGWVPAWGLLGIVIAFLALESPGLIPLWAVVLGIIGAAGPAIKGAASVPDAITTVMQGLPVVVVFLVGALARSGPGRRLHAALSRKPE
ncbi:nucleoside ABC transporter membrane protein [Pseudonocardia thermophila]|jgi:ABC-type uncharacterized transport system, permease component|uniref:Nucleoside ABC transporter membrane protein n=1 Tax=Pseudonocardia thermophila TaxID=1848 RepID=A0A1M6Y2X8_PSETH|nr:ABC transporter permease [Pseudonocardia thermophila]SHL12453.1 nucleoside ABC transporter membrane protein [Pseudonocardia thermophila]